MREYILKFTAIFLSVMLLGIQPGIAFAVSSLRIKSMDISVTGTDAVISWTTNKNATACVEFGQNKNYEFKTCVNKNEQSHRIELANLRPETWYYYRVISETDTQRVESLNNKFKTGKRIDKQAPKISDVRIEYVGSSVVFITWKTDEPTRDKIEYGTKRVGERRVSESRLMEEHGMKITGLKEDTSYSFRIRSTDKSGNESVTIPRSFKTYFSKEIDKSPPRFLEISPLAKSDPGIGESTATISWSTSRPATGSVLYGSSPEKLNKRVSVRVMRRNQSVEISGLKPGTQYYYRIMIKDIFGQSGVAPSKEFSYTFMTKGSSDASDYAPKQNQIAPQQKMTIKSSDNPKKKNKPRVLGAKTESENPTVPDSFTPVKPEPGKALYKPIHSAFVYTIINGKRHRITSPESFESYGYSWDDVRIIHPSELEKYPEARLLKSSSNPTVFYVYPDRNIKIAIPNADVFKSYPSNNWSDIVEVNEQDINSYKYAKLITSDKDDSVYYLHNGVIRRIVDSGAFERYNLDKGDIVQVNSKHLSSYRVGEPLR